MPPTLCVSYDGVLKIEVIGQDVADFMRSSLWKIRMPRAKRLADHVEGRFICFDPSLSRHDRMGIVDALSVAEKQGYVIDIAPSFDEAVSEEDSLISEKSRVGLAIKAKNAEVLPAFEEYRRTVDDAMIRPLRDQQAWDSFFLCTMRKSANFSVPGSGKTASVLGVFAFLRARGLATRIVVVCPKNAFGSWRDEWGACFGSDDPCRSLCFHDERFSGVGANRRRRELALNAGRYNLILLNYESLGSYVEELGSLASSKTLLVFDEVHKVKQIGGARAESALAVAEHAQYVIALTGTPIPNSYRDIYNLLHILYPQDYNAFFGFTEQQLKSPSEEMVQAINFALQPFFCRTNKKSLGVPDVLPDRIYEVSAREAESELLLKLRDIYRNDPLALIIRVLQMESDATMLFDALDPEEFDGVINADGGIWGPGLEGCPDSIGSQVDACATSSKTEACVELAQRLVGEGKPLVIWCFFKKSMDNIVRLLSSKGIGVQTINGSTDQQDRERILDAFKARRLQVLVTNPHTLAESVSLHSVCHDAIYFECSYNLVHLLQSKDRIHRLGLPEGQYTQYHFMQTVFDSGDGEWSLDGRIYERLQEKEQTMLDAIDRGVLEPGSTDKEDLMRVFEGLFDVETACRES